MKMRGIVASMYKCPSQDEQTRISADTYEYKWIKCKMTLPMLQTSVRSPKFSQRQKKVKMEGD